MVPVDNDYLRDLGSRRRKKQEDTKDNDTLDVDDLEGILYFLYFLVKYIYITLLGEIRIERSVGDWPLVNCIILSFTH